MAQKSEIKEEDHCIGNRKLKEEFNPSVFFLFGTEARIHEIFWKITLMVVKKVDWKG